MFFIFSSFIWSSERARLFLRFVIVRGDDFIVQHEVVVFLVNFGQDVRERLIHHVHDLFALEQLAILLNGEIAVKFIQYVLWIGGGLNAFVIIQELAIHGVQHLAPLKFDRGVHPFVHEVSQRALGAAKTTVYGVPPSLGDAFWDVNRGRVKITRVPKTARASGAHPNVLKHVTLVKAQLQMV